MANKEEASKLISDGLRKKLLNEICSEKTVGKFEYDKNAPPFFLRFYDMNDQMLFLQFSKIEIRDTLTFPLEGKILFSIEHRGFYYFPTILKQELIQDFTSCMIPLPDAIYEVQRREHFRVSPSDAFPATLVSISGKQVEGKVLIDNISQGGARLVFPTEAKIPIGTTFPDICIGLAGGSEIKLNGIVRLIIRETEQTTLVGVQWSQMTQDSFTKLKEYLLNCQRHIARNKKN